MVIGEFMRNRSNGYFRNDDLTSIETLKTALWELSNPTKSDEEEHQKRSEIAAELIKKLKSDNKISPIDKISFLDAAIVHPAFSSRKLGALKRGLNSFFSGEGPSTNLNPYFQSSSQSMLVTSRDEIEKEYRLEKKATLA